jgi:hypothetical protein
MNICAKGMAAASAWLLIGGGCAVAQNLPPAAPSSPAPNSQPAPDVRSLTELLSSMQEQIKALSSQMADLRKQQQEASVEAGELRRELARTKAELDLRINAANVTAASSIPSPVSAQPKPIGSSSVALADVSPLPVRASSEAPQQPSVEERLASLEENQQLTDGKLADQYQTKIESGAKYRLRLSGTALFNLFDNRGMVDNQDFPALAVPPDPLGAAGAFGGSLRQSRIGLEAFGPDVLGAHTSAKIEFDFAGGFPQANNGSVMGLIRLRTGTMRLDWTNTSIVAGQDYLFFAPLAPTSLAQFAVPALSYAGNLWAWTPQVRVEHRFQLDRGESISVSGGILDSLTGDYPDAGNDLIPSWGEQSGQPAFAARAAWSMPMSDRKMTIGFGGYFGRQFWGFGRNVNGWAVTTDVTVPLGKRFALTAEVYRGNAVGGIGGGIGQTVLTSGSLFDPSATVVGLDSVGGWAQLKYRATPKLEFNAAFGDDNPFAGELRKYSSTYSEYGGLFTRNVSPFGNFIYQVRSDLLFSVEYRYLRTSMLDNGHNSAHHLNLSVGYVF